MENKFEFKVLTDKDGKSIHLDNMPIEAAKAFLNFYQTLVSLAELSKTSEKPHIAIKPGSAVASVDGATAELINKDFESVLSAECSNPAIVKLWRGIQTQVKANGLSYEINHVSSKGSNNLYQKIKESKKFHKKPSRPQYQNSIKFISGTLINVGGKVPNIHVEVDGSKITIDCQEAIALSAKDYLYKPIRIAVWAKEAKLNNSNAYELCDVYSNQEEYDSFKTYFEELESGDRITSLTSIHRRIKHLLAEGDFHKLQKLLKLWLHPTTDIQTLKIILVITKSFSQDKRISNYIEKFKDYFKVQDLKLSKQLKKSRK